MLWSSIETSLLLFSMTVTSGSSSKPTTATAHVICLFRRFSNVWTLFIIQPPQQKQHKRGHWQPLIGRTYAEVICICQKSSAFLSKVCFGFYCIKSLFKHFLIHAFITTRLDYCNSVLVGLPARSCQYVQNSAARVLTHIKSCEQIRPKLRHTLASYTIQHTPLNFTLLSLLDPCFLSSLLSSYCPSWSLRSAVTVVCTFSWAT